MRIFSTAKRLLLIKLGLIAAGTAQAASAQLSPHLDCGIYEAHGRLRRNAHGDFALRMHEHSPAPWEFLLLGGTFREKLARLDADVWVRFYVPKAIHDEDRPWVLWQSFLSKPAAQEINKVQQVPCGQKSFFKGAR